MAEIDNRVHLDKENEGGGWLLTYALGENRTVLRLRVSVGGSWDWHGFQAEVQCGDNLPHLLGRFDISPIEIIPRDEFHDVGEGDAWVETWNPDDAPEFQQLPPPFHAILAAMVRRWGRVVGLTLPAPTWLSVH